MLRHAAMFRVEYLLQRVWFVAELRYEKPMVSHSLAQPMEDQIDGRGAEFCRLHRLRRC